jgi:PAS domain-containing protein
MAGVALWTFEVLRAAGPRGPARSRRGEERLRLYADNARDLVYRYRFGPKPGFEYISPSSIAITGYTPEEHYADPELGLRHLHPDDRHLLDGAVRSPEEPLVLRWYRKTAP